MARFEATVPARREPIAIGRVATAVPFTRCASSSTNARGGIAPLHREGARRDQNLPRSVTITLRGSP
jgi:hypothetical protein